MTRTPEDAEPVRFLVTFQPGDVNAIEDAAKRLHMSRNRLIVVATLAYLKAYPPEVACPICGEIGEHVH